MKKSWIIIAVIAVLALGGGAWWFLTNKATAPSPPSTTTTDTSQPADTATPSSDVRSGTVNIDMKNTAFSLKNVTIKKGTKVVWTNQDSVRHNIVADESNTNGLPTVNDLLGKGQTYTYTFNTVGTVKYHCAPHPFMTATIEVVE